MLIRI